jgi:Tol biopolymer transport system component
MRYWLCRDRSPEREVVGDGVFTCDGHCSFSPDGRWILTDTYPDAEGKRTLILFRPEDGVRVDMGRFHAGGLAGPVRCDLHPRWSPDGRRVCFDSVHEGTRQMYVMDVSEVVGA